MPNALNIKKTLETKRNELKEIFDANRVDGNLSLTEEKQSDVDKRISEIKELGDQYTKVNSLEQAEQENEEALKGFSKVERLPIASNEIKAVKSLGELVVESGVLNGAVAMELPWSVKTLMSTGAGLLPSVPRDNEISRYPLRPLTLLDYIPTMEWNAGFYEFVKGSTHTNNSAEKAESVQGTLAAFGEAALAYTPTTAIMRNIGTWMPVSNTQLEDVPGIADEITNELSYMVKARFESQLLSGAGTGVLIEGMTVVSGVQTQAKAGDDSATAIFKAAQKVRATGFAEPTVIILHPIDYQGIRLLSNTQGSPIFDGGINYGGPALLWGIPVIQTTAIAQGTAFVADLSWYKALVRRGVTIERGKMADDMKNGVSTIVADMRGALAPRRPSAGCKVTGL